MCESNKIIALYGLPNTVKSLEQQFKTINDSIRQQTSKYKIEFEIDEPGFEVFIQSNHQQLLDIVNSKCSLNYLILRQHIRIQIPQAKVFQKLEDNNQSENTPTDPETNRTSNWLLDLFSWGTPKTKTEPPKSSTTTRSIPIGKSKILVCIGDLTQQTV